MAAPPRFPALKSSPPARPNPLPANSTAASTPPQFIPAQRKISSSTPQAAGGPTPSPPHPATSAPPFTPPQKVRTRAPSASPKTSSAECEMLEQLQPFAPAKSRVEVMPILHILLTLLPTKKNFLPTHERRKINQPPLQILDHDFARREPLQNIFALRQRSHIPIDHVPAQVIAEPQHLRDLPIQFLQRM